MTVQSVLKAIIVVVNDNSPEIISLTYGMVFHKDCVRIEKKTTNRPGDTITLA